MRQELEPELRHNRALPRGTPLAHQLHVTEIHQQRKVEERGRPRQRRRPNAGGAVARNLGELLDAFALLDAFVNDPAMTTHDGRRL